MATRGLTCSAKHSGIRGSGRTDCLWKLCLTISGDFFYACRSQTNTWTITEVVIFTLNKIRWILWLDSSAFFVSCSVRVRRNVNLYFLLICVFDFCHFWTTKKFNLGIVLYLCTECCESCLLQHLSGVHVSRRSESDLFWLNNESRKKSKFYSCVVVCVNLQFITRINNNWLPLRIWMTRNCMNHSAIPLKNAACPPILWMWNRVNNNWNDSAVDHISKGLQAIFCSNHKKCYLHILMKAKNNLGNVSPVYRIIILL